MSGASGVSTRAAIDLSQPYFNEMSTSGAHGAPSFTTRPLAAAADYSITITHMAMSAHMGTHVDAPRHFFSDGATIDEYPINRFQGPGVVVDVRRRGVLPVTPDELEGADLREGDFVLFCFGYGEFFGTPTYAEHPYLSAEVANLLIERKVAAVGVDVLTPDMPEAARTAAFGWPVHHLLLRRDILIIENLNANLASLLGQRVHVTALPLAVRGADAAPARVTAIPLEAGES